MSIYKTAIKRPVTTLLFFTAFAIFGIFALLKTPISLLPDFDANTIMVMSSYPGSNASDIENNLTKVLENSLNSVANLKNLYSQSRENTSIISLEFEYGTNISEACNDVRDKLDLINSALPSGASTPVIFKFSGEDIPIMLLSATAVENASGLDKILEDKVVTPLGRVNGVGTISVDGAPKREIQVYCDPNKLQGYGLTVSGIAQTISGENKNIPSGSIDIGEKTYSLRVEKEFKDPSELLEVVVGSFNGKTVYLKDVATVNDGIEEHSKESYTSIGGKNPGSDIRSSVIVIQKQAGANTVEVIKGIKKKMAEIKKGLPSDVKIMTIIDSSNNIKLSISSLKDTILITLLVVMLVVYIFLGRWKATFIIGLSIPISLLGSLLYLFATGNTLNIISMSALSIAIGMVVDDAIVVLENITSHIAKGEDPKEAAEVGTAEVGISVIASTLTMLCVFLPLTMVSGMAGMMFRQLGFIVSIIMIISTTAALTLVPMLCSRLLGKKEQAGKFHNVVFGMSNKAMEYIALKYSKLVNWAVTHRKTVIFSSLGIFLFTIILLGPGLKTEFFPKSDFGRITVKAELPVGTSQDVTAKIGKSIAEDLRREIPEIQILQYNFGRAESGNVFGSLQGQSSNIINMNVNIGSVGSRTVSSTTITEKIRKKLKEYPEIKKATVTEGEGGTGGAATVAIDVYGYDFSQTDYIASELKDKLLESNLFSTVTLSRDEYLPEFQIDFDRTKLALNGLNSSTAAVEFRAAMNGAVSSFYREEGNEYNIRVRYSKEFRKSIEDIENITIYNKQGKGIKLKELGKVIETSVPPSIDRKNRERYVKVTGALAPKKVLGEAAAFANEVIKSTDIPTGISAEISGDFSEQKKMFSDLIMLMVLMTILIYMVMASQFESMVNPFVIMFSVPFAIIGVILGLRITGTPLGVMALIGIIILLGIVVKNGIVLIDCTILLRNKGMSIIEATVEAAKRRLRPILMTTLTTVLGMVPLALGRGEGSEMWRSLGMTVCWGLTISTLVTLVLIPSIYCSFELKQEKRKSKKNS